MKEIRSAISRCLLHLKFDDFTVGETENRHTKTLHYMNVRDAVCKFITSSQHPSIQQFKQSYIENEWPTNGIAWNDYWIAMSQDKVWVDYKFIQGTAWYLNQDIMVITTMSTPVNPYIYISGDINNSNIPCPGVPMLIGSQLDQHFQSLLPSDHTIAPNLEMSEDNFPSLQSSLKTSSFTKKKTQQNRNKENENWRKTDKKRTSKNKVKNVKDAGKKEEMAKKSN